MFVCLRRPTLFTIPKVNSFVGTSPFGKFPSVDWKRNAFNERLTVRGGGNIGIHNTFAHLPYLHWIDHSTYSNLYCRFAMNLCKTWTTANGGDNIWRTIESNLSINLRKGKKNRKVRPNTSSHPHRTCRLSCSSIVHHYYGIDIVVFNLRPILTPAVFVHRMPASRDSAWYSMNTYYLCEIENKFIRLAISDAQTFYAMR